MHNLHYDSIYNSILLINEHNFNIQNSKSYTTLFNDTASGINGI